LFSRERIHSLSFVLSRTVNALSPFRTILLAALVFCTVAAHASGKEVPPSKTGDLFELSKAVPPVGSQYKLSPEWVGTVKRVYLRGGEGIYKEDKPDDIRLTDAWVIVPRARMPVPKGQKDRDPVLQAARMSKAGYAENEAPVFKADLPTAKEVAAMSLKEMKKQFGPQHGVTDGWGGRAGMHWTEGWTWFTFESSTRLRFMNVFAHVRGKPKAEDAAIEILQIREGIFQPANPASGEEKVRFKTKEEIDAIEESERQAGLAKYPQPLRTLIETQGRPDDSDLVAYTKELNAVRAKPDEKLIDQLVVALADDGTTEIAGILRDIYGGSVSAVNLAAWNPAQKTLAQRFLLHALSAATSEEVFEQALITLLESFGGGSVRLKQGDSEIDLVVRKDGYSSGSSIEPENLKAVIKATKSYLLKRHPELGPEK
jgi:hypothetical protein